jgi:hypothetical protein
MVFAFAAPGSGARASSMLGGGNWGWGGYAWSASRGQARAYSGTVVIDSGQVPRMDRRMRTSLYLHEIGHAVGLDHVGDPRQVMHPRLIASTPTKFASGDLAGLKKLGRAAGCLRRAPR